ncbi:hypothetical protein FO440_23820 [Mucilaginibacter corticis]|uniref:Uncharacterized protein n=1 Tax=Mucilaginibacter corticis TaxID=2597670 RepID=A0A556M7T1_9SPHI|nr:hypothetical protein [Mucilaginibacter corticis]TSJ35949.1 hypothetical protein FO440_23820 [Mucilaginibacter corticis]
MNNTIDVITTVIYLSVNLSVGFFVGRNRNCGWQIACSAAFLLPVLGLLLVYFSPKKETITARRLRHITLYDKGLIDEEELALLENAGNSYGH